jgi:hypothetical protein
VKIHEKTDFFYTLCAKYGMLSPRHKIIVCIIGNALILLTVLFTVIILKDDSSKYFRIGPNNDLLIISVKINTYISYILLLVFIAITKLGEVMVEEIGMPILGFRIYNPDAKVITDFGKLELQIMGNLMFVISNIRGILMIVVSVSQIDVALWGVIISNITSVITIRILLNEKKFEKDGQDQSDEMEEMV